MMKRMLSLLLAVVMLLTLTACGKKAEDSGASDAKPAASGKKTASKTSPDKALLGSWLKGGNQKIKLVLEDDGTGLWDNNGDVSFLQWKTADGVLYLTFDASGDSESASFRLDQEDNILRFGSAWFIRKAALDAGIPVVTPEPNYEIWTEQKCLIGGPTFIHRYTQETGWIQDPLPENVTALPLDPTAEINHFAYYFYKPENPGHIPELTFVSDSLTNTTDIPLSPDFTWIDARDKAGTDEFEPSNLFLQARDVLKDPLAVSYSYTFDEQAGTLDPQTVYSINVSWPAYDWEVARQLPSSYELRDMSGEEFINLLIEQYGMYCMGVANPGAGTPTCRYYWDFSDGYLLSVYITNGIEGISRSQWRDIRILPKWFAEESNWIIRLKDGNLWN